MQVSQHLCLDFLHEMLQTLLFPGAVVVESEIEITLLEQFLSLLIFMIKCLPSLLVCFRKAIKCPSLTFSTRFLLQHLSPFIQHLSPPAAGGWFPPIQGTWLST